MTARDKISRLDVMCESGIFRSYEVGEYGVKAIEPAAVGWVVEMWDGRKHEILTTNVIVERGSR